MIKEFQFAFKDLGIVSSDIGELMGYNDGCIPEPFSELINYALNNVPLIFSIRGGYRLFSSEESFVDKSTITICEHIFNPSKIIITQFENATSLGVFICTAGNEITQLAKEVSDNGDPLLSYIYDVIGSATVERATDEVHKAIEIECQKSGLKVSDRFSPGYCDWSVSEQQILFDLVPVNFCGVTLSESSLMSPIKSVSGIIAIGTNLERKGYQCRWCNDKNCLYGKIRRQKKI